MRANARLRLFVDDPADGPTNMALDGCLLEEVSAGQSSTLRLYRWATPTLSLGVFQPYDSASRLAPQLASLPRVRRITGGGAIVHADELTYALALPAWHPWAKGQPIALYQWMHARIAEALSFLGAAVEPRGGVDCPTRNGPFLCYDCVASFDLVCRSPASLTPSDTNEGTAAAQPGRLSPQVPSARKLVGSAQRRTRGGVLQHGSIVLRAHPAQPGASLCEMVHRPVCFEDVAQAVANAMEQAGMACVRAGATRVDSAVLARQLDMHGSDAWLRRR